MRSRALFDWAKLNAVLAEHRLGPPRLRLSGGTPGHAAFSTRHARSGGSAPDLDVGALLSQLRSGATLVLDAAQEVSPPLQRLCAGLSADFTCFCQANLYASWGETQGFDVHWDDHDVFVIQVEGRKRWRLYGRTREAPLSAGDPPDHVAPPEAREEITLEAGDLLYLPRGYWHAAVGLGEPTLHLTIGLTRRTGVDFLHWLADQVGEDTTFRTDLPFEHGDAAIGERLAALVTRLGARDPQALGRAYRRHVEASLARRPSLSFPAIGGPETSPSVADRLQLSDGASRVERDADGDAVVLIWRGVRFTVSAMLADPLQTLTEGGAVAVSDLVDAVGDTERAMAFVREMIGRGVFVLASEGRP